MEINKILVVDDEESIRNLFLDAFDKEEYTVVTVENGEDALELLAKENIKVMFLDLNLPGMNGNELCKKVRQFHPLAIIHAITGYNSLFELVDCRRSGFDDYFTKPLDLPQVYRATKEAFNKLERWGTG
jgi:CheY-like chemotaxis protein